jgi:hypothetical protein
MVFRFCHKRTFIYIKQKVKLSLEVKLPAIKLCTWSKSRQLLCIFECNLFVLFNHNRIVRCSRQKILTSDSACSLFPRNLVPKIKLGKIMIMLSIGLHKFLRKFEIKYYKIFKEFTTEISGRK